MAPNNIQHMHQYQSDTQTSYYKMIFCNEKFFFSEYFHQQPTMRISADNIHANLIDQKVRTISTHKSNMTLHISQSSLYEKLLDFIGSFYIGNSSILPIGLAYLLFSCILA